MNLFNETTRNLLWFGMDVKVRALFEALFALEDLRQVLRETTPHYRLNGEQRLRVSEAVRRVREALTVLEEWRDGDVQPIQIAPGIPVRTVEEEYVSVQPIQRGGVLPAEARKALTAYCDGYSVCDYCLPPFRLDRIRKPNLMELHRELAEFLGMDEARLFPGARRCFQAVMSSLVKPGDTVLVDSLSHYTVYLAAEQAGARVVEVPNTGYPEYRIDPEAYGGRADEVERETGRPPVLAVLSHVDYKVGNLHDAKRVSETLRDRGIPLLLNCAYTAGVMPVDGRELGADFIAASGHKSFASPAPSGILAVREEWADKVFRESRFEEGKEVELLGCTLMGGVSVAMMASLPHVKERVGRWPEEVEKARWLVSQLERIGRSRQLGVKPKQHTLICMEFPDFHEVSKSHRRRGYFLYEELRKRGVFGLQPGLTRRVKLNTYGLSWSQVRHVAEAFKDVAEKYGIPVS